MLNTRRLFDGMLAVLLMMGLGLVATPAQAQDNAFVGVSAVHIFVATTPDDDDAKCNVTKGGLDAAVRLPIDASRLRINPDASPYVYVNANVLMMPDGLCVATFTVGLKRTLAIPGTNQLVFSATVWESATSTIWARSSIFWLQLNQSVSDFTKQLIAEWIKANPRR